MRVRVGGPIRQLIATGLPQIVAVIMCDTGIALLAYMDGITGSPTLAGVVLAVLAAAGYAVFKVGSCGSLAD